MMKARPPTRWATDISAVLNRVRGVDHFPIPVIEIASEFSRIWFPDDPITHVAGDNLPGFDGALVRAPPRQKGWGILYNNAMASRGRINFTLAHEFGHYLIHRVAYPDGMRCGQQDVVRWDTGYRKVEVEANTFAAYLLMPLDDYRRQISASARVTLDLISQCAERYDVSLIAAILRWLQYTERRAALVVSRDGFILWARSSEPALKTGAFIRTAGRAVPIPENSIAARPSGAVGSRDGVELPAGVWFPEPCREMTIFSENYDFTVSLLQLENESRRRYSDDDEEEVQDLGALIRRNHGL